MIDLSEKFWETTYKQNIGKMTGICYRYVGNRQVAEDLAHDAFLTSMNKSSDFEGKGAFEGWLRRIVVNVALQYLREQKKKKYLEDWIAYSMEAMETREDDLTSEEQNYFSEKELLEAINELPDHHKLVFNLYVIDNFTHAQIGQELGISEGTSKSHLSRARRKIRASLVQNMKETRREDKRKYAFLMLIPFKIRGVDRLYRKSFSDFELQPQHFGRRDAINFSNTPLPRIIQTATYPATILKMSIVVATIGIATFLALDPPEEQHGANTFSESGPVIKPVEDSAAFEAQSAVKFQSRDTTQSAFDTSDVSGGNNKLTFFDSSDATILKKGILLSENIKQIENMKNLKTLATLLIAGSGLATDSSAGIRKMDLPSEFRTSAVSSSIKSKGQTTKKVSETSGTFYASSLFWSAGNNELYFMGRVVVNVGKNNFVGNGSFTFLGEVHYLVFNGVPVKLNDTFSLLEKKYTLQVLSAKEAIKKYGEKGEKGAVEIEIIR